MKAATVAALALVGAAAASAEVQRSERPRAELLAAIEAGIVGEKFDGYLGFAREPSDVVRRQAAGVNIRRRALYIGFASRRGLLPEVAALATACQLLERIPIGRAYLLEDGVWRWRKAGEPPPVPDYCA